MNERTALNWQIATMMHKMTKMTLAEVAAQKRVEAELAEAKMNEAVRFQPVVIEERTWV